MSRNNYIYIYIYFFFSPKMWVCEWLYIEAKMEIKKEKAKNGPQHIQLRDS